CSATNRTRAPWATARSSTATSTSPAGPRRTTRGSKNSRRNCRIAASRKRPARRKAINNVRGRPAVLLRRRPLAEFEFIAAAHARAGLLMADLTDLAPEVHDERLAVLDRLHELHLEVRRPRQQPARD